MSDDCKHEPSGHVPDTSINERAEQLMGKRPGNVVPFDGPPELGYTCPVCKVPPLKPDDNFDERLQWSEYNGFLWCEVCDYDYPSALCVPITTNPNPDRDFWVNEGRDDAVKVFLDQIERAVWLATNNESES